MFYHKQKEIQPEILLDNDNKTFHYAVRPGELLIFNLNCLFLCLISNFIVAILIAQIFGLFPLYGISSKNPKDITFKWISLRTFFSLFSFFSYIIVLSLIFYRQTQLGPLTASNIVGIIFFANCALIFLLFFNISQKWRTIIMK